MRDNRMNTAPLYRVNYLRCLLESLHLAKSHGRGRRFDPDQVHQISQQLRRGHLCECDVILGSDSVFESPASQTAQGFNSNWFLRKSRVRVANAATRLLKRDPARILFPQCSARKNW